MLETESVKNKSVTLIGTQLMKFSSVHGYGLTTIQWCVTHFVIYAPNNVFTYAYLMLQMVTDAFLMCQRRIGALLPFLPWQRGIFA